MRFFSSDSKESTRRPVQRGRPGPRRRAEPGPGARRPPGTGAVRPGLGTAAAGRLAVGGRTGNSAADDELADAGTQAGTAERAATGTTTSVRPFHEPGAQPTAFGASTVGGAVAASATANPQNDSWDVTDRDTAADSGVGR